MDQNKQQIRQSGTMSTNEYVDSVPFNKAYDDVNIPICIATFAFKLITILIYLLLKLLTDQDLLIFILVVFLMSLDFWCIKNICGRKLVGLRWFSRIDQSNQEHWYFESCQPNRVISKFNLAVFWGSQVIAIIFWIVITVLNILSLFWAALSILCLVLLLSNFINFMECKGVHQKKVNQVTNRIGVNFYDQNHQNYHAEEKNNKL